MPDGLKIKTVRESKGIKSCFVAKQLGLHENTYSLLERGKIELTVNRARRIAEILGVSLGELLDVNMKKTAS